jgi:hypothetical protein
MGASGMFAMLLSRVCTFSADGTVSRECTRSASGGIAHAADFADSQHQPLNSVGHRLLPICGILACFLAQRIEIYAREDIYTRK